ncbi:MAG: hypothetical protein P8P99_12820 [Maricaulis sp.]|nr:hypothetical protein [Maricaulis sp.]
MSKKSQALGYLNANHVLARDPLQFIVSKVMPSGFRKAVFWSEQGQEGLRTHLKRCAITLDDAGETLLSSMPTNADVSEARGAAPMDRKGSSVKVGHQLLLGL